MEIQETTVPQSTETTAVAPEPIAQEATQSAEASNQPSVSGTEPQVPQAPEWKPSFKYKAYDKEYDIDEPYRKFIKDKESEEMIAKLFSKSHGFENLKEMHTKVRQELASIKPEYEKLNGALDELNYMYSKGDYAGFFERLKIPENVIVQRAMEILKLQDLPEDQKRAYNESRELQRRSYGLEKINLDLSEKLQNLEVQTRTIQLEKVLSQPDIAQTAQAFDQIYGQRAFWNEVVNAGVAHHAMTGEDLPPHEAVKKVVDKFAPFLKMQTQGSTTNPATGQPQPLTKPKEVPVIPNTGAAGAISPTKRNIRSVDDLRKLREERMGS